MAEGVQLVGVRFPGPVRNQAAGFSSVPGAAPRSNPHGAPLAEPIPLDLPSNTSTKTPGCEP
jgi:hypothetical protein